MKERRGTASPKLLMGLGVAVLLILASMYVGITSSVGIFAFVVGAVALLKLASPGTSAYVSGIPIFGHLNKQASMVVLALSVVALIFVGAISMPSGTTADVTRFTSITGDVIPATGLDACLMQAKNINPDNVGKAATGTVNAYDQESNTPYSAAVDVNPVYFWKLGAEEAAKSTSDTSAYSLTGYNVGDIIYSAGGSTTYYVDNVNAFCIDRVNFDYSMDAHKVVGEADMQTKLYADAGANNELSAGTASEDDYTVALGANEEEDFYLKIKTNVANEAFNFAGVATTRFYNITDVSVMDSSLHDFTKVATPKFLQSVDVKVNESGTATTLSKDYVLYKRLTPMLMQEWASVEIKVIVETDSTNDPDAGGGTSTVDGFALIAVDASAARGDDGKLHTDIYQHDSAEATTGLSETVTSPLGGEIGVLVEVS